MFIWGSHTIRQATGRLVARVDTAQTVGREGSHRVAWLPGPVGREVWAAVGPGVSLWLLCGLSHQLQQGRGKIATTLRDCLALWGAVSISPV